MLEGLGHNGARSGLAGRLVLAALLSMTMFTCSYSAQAATVYTFFAGSPLTTYDSGDSYITRGIVKDVTGDGIADFVSLAEGSAGVSIVRGLGSGQFTESQLFTLGGTPTDIETGDFTGDGVSDILILDNSQHKLKVLSIEDVAASSISVKTVDVSLSSSIYSTTTLSSHQTLETGDLDGDGDLDVVVGATHYPDTNFYPGFSVVEQGAAGLSWSKDYEGPAVSVGGGSGLIEATLGDLTGDGDLDYVIATPNNHLIVARGSSGTSFIDIGGSAFSPTSIDTVIGNSISVPFGNGAAAPLINDFNQDGFNDVLTTSVDFVKIFYTNGDWSRDVGHAVDSTDEIATDLRIGRSSRYYVTAQADDLNDDGTDDVLLTSGDQVGFLTGSADGSLSFDSSLKVNAQSTSLTVAKDVAGDSMLDLITFGGRATTHGIDAGKIALRTAGLSTLEEPGSDDSEIDWDTTDQDDSDHIPTQTDTEPDPSSEPPKEQLPVVGVEDPVELSEEEIAICKKQLYVAQKSASSSKSKKLGSKRAYLQGPEGGHLVRGEKPAFTVQFKDGSSTIRRIRKATFYLNGEKLVTVDSPVFGLKLVTDKLAAATGRGKKHRIEVKVKRKGSQEARTLKLDFYLNECKPAAFEAKVKGLSKTGEGKAGVSLSASTGDSGVSKVQFNLARQLKLKVRQGKSVGKIKITSGSKVVTEKLKISRESGQYARQLTLLDRGRLRVTLKRGKQRGGWVLVEGLPAESADVKIELSKDSELVTAKEHCSKAEFKVRLTPEVQGSDPLELSSESEYSCRGE